MFPVLPSKIPPDLDQLILDVATASAALGRGIHPLIREEIARARQASVQGQDRAQLSARAPGPHRSPGSDGGAAQTRAVLQQAARGHPVAVVPGELRDRGMASSHHRFLWIHHFPDGSGRVARLLSIAYAYKTGERRSHLEIRRGGPGHLRREATPRGGHRQRIVCRQGRPKPNALRRLAARHLGRHGGRAVPGAGLMTKPPPRRPFCIIDGWPQRARFSSCASPLWATSF